MDTVKLSLIKLSDDPHEPINLLTISSYLKKYIPELEIRIIDRAYENVLEELDKFSPDIVGISAMTVEYSLAIKLCKAIKEKRQILVIVGGTHISFLPNSFDKCFDLGILGEGELPFLELIRKFKENPGTFKEKIRETEGIVFYDDKKLVIKPQKEVLQDLDEIPIPDRSLLNPNNFDVKPVYTIGTYEKRNSILTSRGCPYRCKFCVSARFFNKLRLHSARRVVDEVKYLYEKYGITHINIWDDLFCVSVPRLREIVNLLEKEGIKGKISFHATIRGNLAKDEVFELYKEMGVKSIGLGFESGSQRILEYLKGQNITIEQNLLAIEKGIRQGFKMMTSFMIGVPTEKIEDMKKTRDIMKKCINMGISRLFIYILTPFPGSEFWDLALEKGKVSEDMDFSKLSFHNKIPLLMDEDVPIKEYLKVRKQILKEMNRIKYNCLRDYFKDDPVRTLSGIMKNPFSSLLKAVGLKNEKEEVDEL